jgi:D-methionine transport system permease protein
LPPIACTASTSPWSTSRAAVSTIVRKVLVSEALPSLIAGTTTTAIALIGYSVMAGTVGGGLGDLAVRHGYQRFESGLMWVTVAILAVVISLIQFTGDHAARTLHRRGARTGPCLCLCLRRLKTDRADRADKFATAEELAAADVGKAA